MIIILVAILISFLWFLWETNWLTARLPYGKPEEELNIVQIVNIMIAVVIAINLMPVITNLVEDMETEQIK